MIAVTGHEAADWILDQEVWAIVLIWMGVALAWAALWGLIGAIIGWFW